MTTLVEHNDALSEIVFKCAEEVENCADNVRTDLSNTKRDVCGALYSLQHLREQASRAITLCEVLEKMLREE